MNEKRFGVRNLNYVIATVALFVATGMLTAGCGRKATAGAGGTRLDGCAAVSLYNRLKQPTPNDRKAVVRYASDFSSILKNVSFKEKYKDTKNKRQTLGRAVIRDINTMRTSMYRYRDAVKPSSANLTKAEADLAADVQFMEADRRMQTFRTGECHE